MSAAIDTLRAEANALLEKRDALPDGPERDAVQAEYERNQKMWSATLKMEAKSARVVCRCRRCQPDDLIETRRIG